MSSIFDIFKSMRVQQLEVDHEYLNQLQFAWNRLFACLVGYNEKLRPHTLYRRSQLTNASDQALVEVKRLQKETEAQRVALSTMGAQKDGAIMDQANAWMALWDILKHHNPEFMQVHGSGRENAVAEIKRLQALDKKPTKKSTINPGPLKPSHLYNKFSAKPLTKTEIKGIRVLLAGAAAREEFYDK